MQTYQLNENYVPTYTYILEKDGEELEFSTYSSILETILDWDDFNDVLHEKEKELASPFPAGAEDDREEWIYDTMEEMLEEMGWQVHKVLN